MSERRIFFACQGNEILGYSIQCESNGVTYKFKSHDFVGLLDCVAEQMMRMAPPQDEPKDEPSAEIAEIVSTIIT